MTLWQTILIGGVSAGLVVIAGGFILAWSSTAPAHVGPGHTRLAPCPERPNCVSSDAPSSSSHHIPALHLAVPAEQAWQALIQTLSQQARIQIQYQDASYLHATARSAFFGFIDDLECQLRPSAGIVAIRSASRVGHSDFGVNRQRVNAIRQQLIVNGILTPTPQGP